MSSDAGWDARYAAEPEGMFSGNVNGTLAVEVTGMAPRRALDVGCGEGADAVWLALAGWEVTGLDVSAVAIERAEAAGRSAGARVNWVVGDFATTSVGAFDLVTAHYPALPQTPDDAVQNALKAAVAPGGTLLYVGHAPMDRERALARGFDPDDFVLPGDVRRTLDEGWVVEVDELRPRPGGAPHGTPFTHDEVLRARRL